MPNIIKADDGAVSGVSGITSTADTSGVLELQATAQQVTMGNVTGAMITPKGTTAQRPTKVAGMIRYNSTNGQFEVTDGIYWYAINVTNAEVYVIDYLVVAGGGGGGARGGGGGGAGGYRTVSGLTVTPGNSFTVTIGAGGAGSTTPGSGFTRGASGSNSVFSTTTSAGGGGGGTVDAIPASGGSGGGGSYAFGSQAGAAGNTPSVSPSQGNAGGVGTFNNQANANGGGGGGAGGVGGDSSLSGNGVGGAGGAGVSSSISGSSVTYAAGGAGGAFTPQTVAVAGTANRGNGGGGAGGETNFGAAGGSGVVIITYANASQRGTGGTVTSYTSGGITYWAHTFTSSGTYTA